MDDCLKSFQLNISQSQAFTNNDYRTWGVLGNYHWVLNYQGNSVYTIEGFKNILIYGVEMVGYVQANNLASTTKGIVQDYGFNVILDGQYPSINGVVSPTIDFWGINPFQKRIALTKYQNRYNFFAPVVSPKTITFNRLVAQGNQAEDSATLNLSYDLTFNFFYKYEGE